MKNDRKQILESDSQQKKVTITINSQDNYQCNNQIKTINNSNHQEYKSVIYISL